MHSYLLFLQSGLSCDLKEIKAGMDNYFSEKPAQRPDKTEIRSDVLDTKDVLVVTYDEYEFYILINHADYVNKELMKYYKHYKGLDFDDKAVNINLYKDTRMSIELFGDEDFDMNYFNESIFLLTYFEKRGGLLIYNRK